MMYRVLAIALLGLAFGTMSLDAQGTKKPSKKDEPAGSIELYQNKEGHYRFRIKNHEGKTIAMPLPQMSWEKKADALKAIDELKSILDHATPVEVKDEHKKEEPKKDAKKAAN